VLWLVLHVVMLCYVTCVYPMLGAIMNPPENIVPEAIPHEPYVCSRIARVIWCILGPKHVVRAFMHKEVMWVCHWWKETAPNNRLLQAAGLLFVRNVRLVFHVCASFLCCCLIQGKDNPIQMY
jgi:hypothetical protein